MASALIRPDKPADRVEEALTRIREGLNAATEAIGDVLRQVDQGDGMHRRELLRTLTAAASTAVLPPGSLERMVEVAQAVGRSRKVDAGLLKRLEDVTSSLAQSFYASTPEALTGPVRGLADTLTRLLDDGTMEPGQRTRLASLAADTHLFAGWLALDSDVRADARAYFRVARDLAREAGDGVLHSLALDADGVLYALHTPDHRRGDPHRAAWQIGQASSALPADAPATARAYLSVSEARHRAMTGVLYGFQAGMVRAEEAVERARLGQGPESRGFMSGEGWLSVVADGTWLADYEGRGLVELGRHSAAAEVLSRAVDADADGNLRRRSGTLISLATAYAPDEPAQAVAAAVKAFDMVARAGYGVEYPALDALRRKLPDDVPGVADLDERLATV